MSTILEELQARCDDAKKRFDDANRAFQQVQQNLVSTQQNYNIWAQAVQAEIRDEQSRQAAAAEKQMPLPTTQPEAPRLLLDAQIVSDDNSDSLNKTDIVRELLHRHPDGMTAIQIWQEVGSQFKHRPYLYSVLKRLRDRDEVTMRRKKYCLKLAAKVEEAKRNAITAMEAVQ